MAATREFALNIDAETPSGSKVTQTPYAVKGFIQGDTIHFVITLVKLNPVSGQGALSIVDGTGLGMTIALGTPGGAVVASATMVAPVAPDGAFTGDLAIASAAAVGLYTLDIRVSDPLFQTFRIKNVPIEALLIASTLVPVVAPDTGLGVNEANATYARLDGVNILIFIDQADGSKHMARVNNGIFEVSPLT